MDRRAFLFPLVLVGMSASPVAAQPRTVFILPWTAAETDVASLAAHAEAAAGALPSGELNALPLEDARVAFEARGSAEPPSVTDSEIDQWTALSRLAVRHLAHADYTAAREALLEADRLSERAAAELNREEARARQVLDTCLFDVRAYVETNDPRAAPRTMECRRLVPRVAPSPYIHTPEVVELLGRVDRELTAAPPGSLHLDSEPSGCTVRLNGIDVGTTPFVSTDLASGEYRVQVECGSGMRGRVHRLRLGEGTSTVSIDTRLDRVVRSDTVLRLAYPTQAEADEHRLGDALSVAATLGAAEVWLISLEATGVVRIDRVIVASGSPLASVRASGVSGLSGAVVALADGRSEDRTGARPVEIESWHGGLLAAEPVVVESPSPVSGGWGRADWEIGLAVGAGVAAIGGFAASLILADDAARIGLASSAYALGDPLYVSSRNAWQAQREMSWAFGVGGAVLATLAVGLAMEEERGTPWWSWMLGGVGLAGVVTGSVLIATATECGTGRAVQACVDGSRRVDFGVSAISLSVPFVAVPFIFLLREATGPQVSASVEITSDSAMLHIERAW